MIFITALTTILHLSSTIKMHFSYLKGSHFNMLKTNKDYKEFPFNKLSKKINISENNPEKTYLSDGIWKLIRTKEIGSKIFNDANIFHYRDLLDYKIFPFNGEFKNSSKYQLRKSKTKMYSTIEPRLEEINHNIFFNLFNIRYLLILESEKKMINFSKFKEITQIKFESDIILLLEKINTSKVIINDSKILDSNNCKSYPMVQCLLNIKSLFSLSDKITIKRLGLNKYEIMNDSDKSEKIILPFVYDYGWKSVSGSIKKVNNTLLYLELPQNSKDVIYYKDSIRLYLKILSVFTFIFLILLIVTYNKKITINFIKFFK